MSKGAYEGGPLPESLPDKLEPPDFGEGFTPANTPERETEEETVLVQKSAFDQENILPAILITLTRIYDAQMALLGAMDGEAALALSRAHENGMLLSPPPAFVGEE